MCCTLDERVEIKKVHVAFEDVFSWSYEDQNNFMSGKFNHEIPLKPNATPFREKKRNCNNIVEGEIFKEIDRML